MPKTPRVTPRRLIAALQRIGFSIVRQKGSHVFMRHPDSRCTIIPCHTKDIPIGTINGILSDIDLTGDDLRQLL